MPLRLLTAIVNGLKGHRGLGAWKGIDEPAWRKSPAAGLVRAYKRIKAHLGVPKELANAKTVAPEAAKREAKAYLTVAELSSWLGRPTPNKEA